MYGRYCAALLYQASYRKKPAEQIIQDAYRYYTSISRQDAEASFPRYELYMTEALVFTGHVDEALYYIEEVRKIYSEKDDFNHWKFFQSFLLFEAIAYTHKKDLTRAIDIFQRIRPAEFYFLRKSFSNILYLVLGRQLRLFSSKQLEPLELLLEETGFLTLNSIFISD